MTIQLSSGPATLRVRIDGPNSIARRTIVELVLPTGEILIGWSYCAPGDQFRRFTGKRLAFERLLYGAANGWHGPWVHTNHWDPHRRRAVPLALADRADRGRLWAAILGPKFASAKWPRLAQPEAATVSDAEEPLAVGLGWF